MWHFQMVSSEWTRFSYAICIDCINPEEYLRFPDMTFMLLYHQPCFYDHPFSGHGWQNFQTFGFGGQQAFYEPTISCLVHNICLRWNTIVIFCHNSTRSPIQQEW